MKRLFIYSVSLAALIGAILTLLQSIYLVWLRFGLFPSTLQRFDLDSLPVKKANLNFILHMTELLIIFTVIEISLFWLLVILGTLSQRQGLVATLLLVASVGAIVLFAFSASVIRGN